MDRKLLERLYYDGIMPRERCCPRKKDYHDTMITMVRKALKLSMSIW